MTPSGAVGADGRDRRVVLVTGSSSGIGAATARRFAAAGATVVVNSARSVEAGEALAAELPGASYVRADVADERDESVHRINEDLAREELRREVEMQGIVERYGSGRAAVMAVKAGADPRRPQDGAPSRQLLHAAATPARPRMMAATRSTRRR